VASISKHFTAMSIVLLARDGKLSLDDDIRKYLPEVPDFGKKITIRHLIHHTSGLRDQWSLLGLGGWRPDDPKSEADILALVKRQRALNFDPGAEHLYSNTGYTLMGTIVQRVSGKSLREFTTERIFAPLGMTNTHFHDDHGMIVPGRTSAYQLRPGRAGPGPRRIDDYMISIPVFDNAGATSLFTTVQDMAKWERNFLEPKVGDAALLQQMYEKGKLNDGTELSYAFALTHGNVRGLKTIGHGGADAGYRADFVRFPDQKHAFITMCNVASANPGLLNVGVATAVLGDRMTPIPPRAQAPAAPAEVPIDPAILRTLAGVYVVERTLDMADVDYRDSTKSLHAGRAPAAPRLIHVGNNEFVLVNPNGSQQRYRLANNTMTTPSQPGVTMQRKDFAVVTPTALAQVAGKYRSEELDVEWEMSALDGSLRLTRRFTPAQRLNPMFADTFTGPIGSIRFTRNASGSVDGFLLSAGRVRNIRFDKAGK
jgi:CubicO group peptidase (beta-lactamase class C family)